ncbi:uridine phosphorylase [Acutalibacter sp. 1XD8-33]|uniref:nucleoside phosphorylase n=1 Tax=Acutalibacter sp. 1XD8-33 TaxID=2320081 RepID=UPI000EA255C9|nr:nucleoside phosphorylase [Acutalibacter sp. 1XD8-33]RKJ41706.1 uridine phosphorylase [Acutalibacter sp. 1XD8-33]
MQWFYQDDRTLPVFTAEQHINSKHVSSPGIHLPERAVTFCLGRGLPLLEERFDTRLLMKRLPGFITHSPVLEILGREGVCFLDGGRGAPQAACTVETLHAMGVKEILVAGLCGAFGEDIVVGDVLLPERLLCEEGASRHYFPNPEFICPNPVFSSETAVKALARRGFSVKRRDTVTTDAPYRQTYYKEALWREKGCAGVDMETSAMASLCNYYGMGCTVLLMASDKHPLAPDSPPWKWGDENFAHRQDDFIMACAELSFS